jgi:transposase
MSQKRRTYSADFKLEAVMELLRGHKPVAQICRERGIRDNLLYKWRDAFLERAPEIFAPTNGHNHDAQAARIAELERMVGRLAVENDILKKADSLLGQLRQKRGS